MEGLFLLFGEFIGALMIPLFAGAVELGGLLVTLLLEAGSAVLEWRSGRSRPGGTDARDNPPPARRVRPRWVRRMAAGLAVLLAVTTGAALLAEFVFFKQTLRFCLRLAEQTNGISVTFADAEGSLFRRAVTLTGVTARREGHESSNFDLHIGKVDLALGLRLTGGDRVLERLHVANLTGRIDVRREGGEKPPRKAFVVRDLRLERAALQVNATGSDRTVGLPVVVSLWEGRDISSRSVVFDVLFRSRAAGTLADRDFLITSEKQGGGRVTNWKADGIPVDVVGALAGGIFSWLRGGALDVDVKDRWDLAGRTDIAMEWKLRLREVKAEVPDGLTPGKAALAAPVAAYLNEHGHDLPLEFRFVLNENEFTGGTSADLSALWAAFSTAVFRQIAEQAGVKPESVREGFKAGADLFKDFLDRKRRRDDADGDKPEKKGLLDRLRGRDKPAGEAGH